MPDREKVINALERCESYGQCDDDLCPYYKEVACLEELRQDTLTMLNGQEAEIRQLKLANHDLEEKLRLLEYGDQDVLQSAMMSAT